MVAGTNHTILPYAVGTFDYYGPTFIGTNRGQRLSTQDGHTSTMVFPWQYRFKRRDLFC